ncbi:MAG TPA: efflux transporter outer membrane subunit [Burkholderiaceae bacterium]|nr:efflux transporter outer membrane subunit [Burkholderiaceae bacterium]
MNPVFGKLPLTLAALSLVGACATLEPELPLADPAIPATWPLPPTTPGAAEVPAEPARMPADAVVADVGWREFFADTRLQELIARALRNNRDMRVAVLNVERAQSLYRIQRADRFPSVGVNAVASRSGGSTGLGVAEGYRADIGIAAFELDLFGRVRSLSQSALQQYFAQESAQRSAQLSLVAEIASAYLTLAADQELLRVAQATLKSQEESFRLTDQRHRLGAVSGVDLAQARTTVETARADSARFAGFVAQDRNALALLVGGQIEPELLPGQQEGRVSGLGPLPPGLPSEVLLRRPDVLQSEYLLRAANANIGAARAAFFPSITLTGNVGSLSTELSELFSAGTGGWSFVPQLHLPIFQGGRLRAALGVAQAEREIALAQYERAIQAGFREVADALALTRTLAEQRQAQLALLDAASDAYELAQARYKAGQDSFLTTLDAQRTQYAAEQALITTRLAEQINRVSLYKALGGGWVERQGS